ncbi:IS30 family transposase [Spiroplasma poulsonii]|uniref:IS30 family transposase n=2 Tax=Spiroplasma poulsonii TaxID=2138 RepID=UPI001D13B5C8|nr:IS30 family transposase [Spiroplasma poulsonii]
MDKRFNKYHDTPEQICKNYEKEFGSKFPICVKTLYKYIYSGLLNLSKENLYFHGKRFKTKNRKDNRGKIRNFKTIEQAKHDKYEFGWFQMDTVVGKDHQSSCLVLTEELSKKTFCKKLNENSVVEVTKAIKKILNNKIFKTINIKGIVTDQGKEFSNWKEIEKIACTNVYFCDAGTPTQKPLVERINRDIRHWFPKGTDFNNITQQEIDWVIDVINNKPRACLQWLTSQQLFLNLSSHI